MTTGAWEYWYEITESTALRQGDILSDLIVLSLPQSLPSQNRDLPRTATVSVNADWHRGTWIVMSASCDVVRDPLVYPYALLGRVLPADREKLKARDDKELNKRREVLRKGLSPNRFLLCEHPGVSPPFPVSFVQYRIHVTMPVEYLRRQCVGQRLRLKSPFRESFGAWVGACIARVGPEEEWQIPEFYGKFSDEHVLDANEGD